MFLIKHGTYSYLITLLLNLTQIQASFCCLNEARLMVLAPDRIKCDGNKITVN